MSREICPNCSYPVKTCVCEFISPATHRTPLIFLQHPNETNNAKNTLRLIELVSNNIQIQIGESEQDFAELKKEVLNNKEQFVLLFPSEQATEITELNSQQTSDKTVIILDGTWKKAKKLLLLNPWLNDIQHVKLASDENGNVIQGNYKIRSTKLEGALSTIEATALCLEQLENADVSPFYKALDGLNQNFTKLMPNDVKSRY